MPTNNAGYVLSFSGGKDSTAMLHLMLERGERINAVIWCDMGDWEFPEMERHVRLVEAKTGVSVSRVHPALSPGYLAFDHEYEHNGRQVRGYGWPFMQKRFCTKYKTRAIEKKSAEIGGVQCIGLAVDETRRTRLPGKRYPLDEYGYTEADCLAYCKRWATTGRACMTFIAACPAGVARYRVCRICGCCGDTSRSCGRVCWRWTPATRPTTGVFATRPLPRWTAVSPLKTSNNHCLEAPDED